MPGKPTIEPFRDRPEREDLRPVTRPLRFPREVLLPQGGDIRLTTQQVVKHASAHAVDARWNTRDTVTMVVAGIHRGFRQDRACFGALKDQGLARGLGPDQINQPGTDHVQRLHPSPLTKQALAGIEFSPVTRQREQLTDNIG